MEHGTIRLEDNRTSHGAKASYNCHENYTLIGHEERECQDDGVWSGSTPQCLFDWCPNPPAIIGGVVNTTGKRAGDTAIYSCQAGYILFGQAVSFYSLHFQFKNYQTTVLYRYFLVVWVANGQGKRLPANSSTVELRPISTMENTNSKMDRPQFRVI